MRLNARITSLSLLAAAGVAALLLALAACGGDGDDSPTPTPGTPTPSPSPTPKPTPRPSPQETVCAENPDQALATELTIATPARGDSRVSPLNIVAAGETPITLQATLYDENEEVLGETEAVAFDEDAELLSLELDFDVTEPTPACLWVYTPGADDAPENVVQVPLELVTEEPARGVCGPNPEPATLDSLQVDAPEAEAGVSSPLTVSGGIVLSGGVLRLTLYDENEELIAETTDPVAPGEPGELAAFETELEFEVSEETEACLWVWESDEGAPVNVRQVPVTLQP